MLIVICGEDNIGSREYFNQLKKDFQNKGYYLHYISPQYLNQISSLETASPTLFSRKVVYLTENLLIKYKGKTFPETTIIDWEEKSLYELKIPIDATVKEFKLPTSIFKLLDACYPGNLANFLKILHQLPSKTDDGFIFIMLVRHIRNLLLLKMGEKISRLPSWQLTKLKFQANRWSENKLLFFYDGLYRIDVAIKTSTNPFNIKKSLDILSTYFL